MNFKKIIKKIWLSLSNKNRIVLLDFPVIPKRLYTEGTLGPHISLFKIINEKRASYKNLLNEAIKYEKQFLSIKEDKDVNNATDPGWNNGFFPGLDIIMLYTILAEVKPQKYLEIGSGTSTRVAYKARKDNGLSYTITSIDPSPRKEIKDVADITERKKIQTVPPDYFQSLDEGDILFFDGTHLLYPNSDVMWFFLEVLPVIKKGVYVHVHDIYLPYDYPQFMCDRYYNEQYILANYLLYAKDRYEIICPNYFIYTEKELHSTLAPLWSNKIFNTIEKHGGSFWFKII